MSNIALKEKAKLFPNEPGVYLFKNEVGKVLYVGKAKNLRARVTQYFGVDTRPQIPYLMKDARDIDYFVVKTELESLYLENTLIKQYWPEYNIMLKDDKNYAFIKIDYTTEIPTIGYSRKIENSNPAKVRYFGPYGSVQKIRQTLEAARRIFKYCTYEKVGKRPCFYYHLHRCPGVCFGAISLEEYTSNFNKIVQFISGKTAETKREITQQMQSASKHKRYEVAAKLRDQLQALSILEQKQLTQFAQKVNWDFVARYSENNTLCFTLLKVRDGKMIDKENFVFTNTDMEESVLDPFLQLYYADTSDLPSKIFIESENFNKDLFEELLNSRSKKKIGVEVPKIGDKQKLIDLAKLNSKEYLMKWQNSSAEYKDLLQKSLAELQVILGLPSIPKRIEGYDISNIQGTNPVGSMVVSIDGKAAKSEYKKFKINVKNTPDDFTMMREMISRRLRHLSPSPNPSHKGKGTVPSSKTDNDAYNPPLSKENKHTVILPPLDGEGKGGVTYWPTPDLIMIDGGKGQLGVAYEELQKADLNIPVIGLAKRIEEIFRPNNPEPIVLSHDNPVLHILQRLRDEAHRFAITFHRDLRSKSAVKSELDTIAGIGPKTKKLLKSKFGTVKDIKSASLEELTNLVGVKLAKKIKNI